MWRGDLYFLRCCCKAFLPPKDEDDGDEDLKDYYELLGVTRNASAEEIRRAYKKRSLEFHPDKIAQRRGNGNFDEEASRRKFQRIKEAYEVLMNSKKRDIYDIMGQEAMPYVLNPSSIEFKTVYENLAGASILDRLKIVLGYFTMFFIFLIQPILICLKVDDDDGGVFDQSSWVMLLIPLWILDFVAFMSQILLFSLIRKENAPSRGNQLLSFLKLLSVVLAQILLAIKLDNVVSWTYAVVFIPIYVYKIIQVTQSVWIIVLNGEEISKMVTMAFIEREHGKPYEDMSPEERDEMNEKYIIVHTPPVPHDMDEALKELVDNLDIYESPEYQQVQQSSQNAMGEILSAIMHVVFLGLLVPNLDGDFFNWNWWIVFIPFWISFCFQCCKSCFILCCQEDINESDEDENENDETENNDNAANVVEAHNEPVALDIKNADTDIEKNSAQNDPQSLVFSETQTRDKMEDVEKILESVEPIKENILNEEEVEFEDAEEEFEEFENEESSSSVEATTQAIGSCCLALFYLTIVCIFVGKLQAGEDSYSAFWVIFPILLPAGIMFCCASLGILTFHGMDAFLTKTEEDNEIAGQKSDIESGFSDRLSPSDIDKVSVRSIGDSDMKDVKLSDHSPNFETDVECEMDELD